jgi:polysaccharide biosynthesis transport protein
LDLPHIPSRLYRLCADAVSLKTDAATAVDSSLPIVGYRSLPSVHEELEERAVQESSGRSTISSATSIAIQQGAAERRPQFEGTMLDAKRGADFFLSRPAPMAAHEPSAAETIARSLGIARRQIFAVLAFALLGLAIGGVILLRAAPKYTATATLLAETRKIELIQQPTVSDEAIQSIGAMETQVELLRSDEVALRVIRKLNLLDDKRFIGGKNRSALWSFLDNFSPGYFAESPQALSNGERDSLAVAQFHKSLTVSRIGVTYAIEIDFESTHPDLAAEVANAVADVYIELQRTKEYEAARRASDWLEQRIPEVRAKSEEAQNAVVDYKHEHNIVETGSGRLIDDQRLTNMSDKLNAAHDETLKAKARLDEFSAAIGTEVPRTLASEPDASHTGVNLLDKLRSQYLDVVSKEAESSAKFGPNNPEIISLRNQKAQLRSEITDEIQRLKDASASDYAAAELRESTLKKEFDGAVAQYQQANQAQVKLRELEASAQAYQDLYNTFISRYSASLQQIASPIAEASVITPATPLIQRDYKKTYKTAALFPALGLAVGLGIALLREVFDGRVFLTSKSIQLRLHIACIGLLPKVRDRKGRGWWAKRKPQGGDATRTLVRGNRGISWTAVDDPSSRFSEGVRSIKLAIDLENRSRSCKVIGFTSATASEGKSTVALAVGELIAHNGASVIVVDCDLRNPSLTRSVAPNVANGIVELAYGRASLANVVWQDLSTKMAFLPSIANMGPPDPPSVLSSAEFKRVFDELRTKYEFIIVDLSPLGGVVDVCATIELIEAYVLVIEWGRTTVDVVEHAIRAVPNVSESILGAVLNKADIKSLATYDPYLTSYYFHKSEH